MNETKMKTNTNKKNVECEGCVYFKKRKTNVKVLTTGTNLERDIYSCRYFEIDSDEDVELLTRSLCKGEHKKVMKLDGLTLEELKKQLVKECEFSSDFTNLMKLGRNLVIFDVKRSGLGHYLVRVNGINPHFSFSTLLTSMKFETEEEAYQFAVDENNKLEHSLAIRTRLKPMPRVIELSKEEVLSQIKYKLNI